MPDQELTALKIRIEAEVASAISKLEALSTTAATAATSITNSVNTINKALGSINTKFKVEIDATGFNSIPQKAKEGVENAKRVIRSLTDISLDKIPVGFRVSLDDLLEAKRQLEAQKLVVQSDIEDAVINNKIGLIDAEVKRRRTLLVTGDVNLTDTINKLQAQFAQLKEQRAVISVSADASQLDKLDDEIAFVQSRLVALGAITIDPRVERASLDSFVAGIKNGFDVTEAELINFNSRAKSLLQFAIGVDKDELTNISTFLSDEIRKAESVSKIKLQIDQSNANAVFETIKSGAERSVPVVKQLQKVLQDIQKKYAIEFGLDSAEFKDVSDKLRFIEGQKKLLDRETIIKFNSTSVSELRNQLNNLPKSVILNATASFNGQQFNELLQDVQNKNVNLTITDIADQLKAQIAELEALNPSIDIDADTSEYDAKVATLRNKLTQVEAIEVKANTAPAELSLKQLQDRAATILANQQSLKIKAEILAPAAELSKLNLLKRRLEADTIKLKGTADLADVNNKLESVKRRILELNKQGIKVQATTGEFISQKSIQNVQNTVAAVKELKRVGGTLRIDIKAAGITEVNRQASQTIRNFEQVIRDAPSFAISAQQGFIAIGNNIGPLTDSFARLAQEAKASGIGIGAALKNALGGWNGVVAVISVAVTTVTLFSKQIFGASKEAEKLKSIFDKIKETTEAIRLGGLSGIAKQQSQLAEVELIIEQINNKNNSLEFRQNAVSRLQSFDKNAFKDIDAQTSSTEELTAALVKYRTTLLAVSEVERVRSNIDTKSGEQAELEILLKDARRTVDRIRDNIKRIREEATASGSTQTESALGIDSEKVKLKEAEIILEGLKKRYNGLTIEIKTLKRELSVVVPGTIVPDDPSQVTGGGADDPLKRILESRKAVLESELKNIKDISERFFIIQSEIASLDLQISNIGEVNREIKTNNFAAYQNALDGINIAAKAAGVELTNLKLTIADPSFFAAPNIEPFAKLRQDAIAARLEIDKLFKSGSLTEDEKLQAEAALEFNIQSDVLKAQKELDSFQLLIKTGIAPQLAPVVPDQSVEMLPELLDTTQAYKDMSYAVEDWGQKLRNSLKPMEEAQKKFQDLNEQIARIIASGVAEAFDDVFTILAETGKITFEQIGDAIKNMVLDITKAIIKLVIMNQILKALSVPSVGAIGGGGGGFDLLKFLFKGFPKFASGGIVTQPTYAMVGEGGQKEAIMPLSYLNTLLSGVGGDANLVARVSGDDLLFVMGRANKRQGRSF